MRRTLATGVVLMVCVLGACGDKDASTSGDAADKDSTSTTTDAKVMDVCGSISADDVGSIVGATFTSEVGPFDACEYSQDDPRAVSVSIDAYPLSDLNGGYDGFKSGTSATLTGSDTVDLDGVGDAAFLTTGTFASGTNTQLQGAVQIGNQVISVNLTQASGLEASVLIDQATKLMNLVVSKA